MPTIVDDLLLIQAKKGETIERHEGALMISAEGKSIACRTDKKQHQKCCIKTISIQLT